MIAYEKLLSWLLKGR